MAKWVFGPGSSRSYSSRHYTILAVQLEVSQIHVMMSGINVAHFISLYCQPKQCCQQNEPANQYLAHAPRLSGQTCTNTQQFSSCTVCQLQVESCLVGTLVKCVQLNQDLSVSCDYSFLTGPNLRAPAAIISPFL